MIKIFLLIIFFVVIGLVQARLVFIMDRAEGLHKDFRISDEFLDSYSAFIGPIYKKEFIENGMVPKKLIAIQMQTKIEYFLISAFYLIYFPFFGHLYLSMG